MGTTLSYAPSCIIFLIVETNSLYLGWNRQLETYDDFNDDDMDIDGQSNGRVSSLRSNKLSQLVTAQPNKSKVKQLTISSLLSVTL